MTSLRQEGRTCDQRFCRMGEFYLASSELAFRYGGLMAQETNRLGIKPVALQVSSDRHGCYVQFTEKTQSKICGRKVSAGGARTAIALTQIGPMPGTVISLGDTTGPDCFRVMVGARREAGRTSRQNNGRLILIARQW